MVQGKFSMVDKKDIKNITDDYESIWRDKTLEYLTNFEYSADGLYEDFQEGLPVYADNMWQKYFTNWFNFQLNTRLRVEKPLVSLDIGSHTGKWTMYLASISDKVICTDIYKESEDIIRKRFDPIIKEHNKELEFKLINGTNLDVIDDESVGLVWSADSLTRLNSYEIITYVEEVLRVLKPKGLALLHIPRHDKVQQSGIHGIPFPKFEPFLLSRTLFEKGKTAIWKDANIRINYSNAYTVRQSIPPGSYYKPFEKVGGNVLETDIMIHEFGDPGVIELPGVGQFIMIEKLETTLPMTLEEDREDTPETK